MSNVMSRMKNVSSLDLSNTGVCVFVHVNMCVYSVCVHVYMRL